VALLSLAGLMATQLKTVMYTNIEGFVDLWQVVPVITPTHKWKEKVRRASCVAS
jgi:hypothetical protein